ncbi:trypsin-like serine protease, partial [Lacticaseibacillus rhamnosus MTCC 5462]
MRAYKLVVRIISIKWLNACRANLSGWRFSPWWLGLAGLVELLRPTTSQMSADLA